MLLSMSLFIHLLTLGLMSAAVIGSFIIHLQVADEPVWSKKLELTKLLGVFGKFGPYNVTILIVTGIVNLVERHGLNFPWPIEVWMVTKMTAFSFLVFNGLYLGPKMGAKRTNLIKDVVEKNAPFDYELLFLKISDNLTTVYYFQIFFIIYIVFVSLFGSGKHAGFY